jgi:Coenzyme PQQ synthesis protein D (PqqD)
MRVFKKKSGNVSMTRAEALKFKPVKSNRVRENRLETGEVILTYPIDIRPWIDRIVKRFGGKASTAVDRKLQLDELGTAVWEQIDGERSVKQVIQWFAKKYQLHTKEAEVSVSRFLRELGKRGLIGLK